MSEFPGPSPQETGAPADFNPNAIPQAEIQELKNQASEAARFDTLLNPDESKQFNPEDAAVRPPLTAAEIAAKRSGEYPTQAQVDGINAARAIGKHLH